MLRKRFAMKSEVVCSFHPGNHGGTVGNDIGGFSVKLRGLQQLVQIGIGVDTHGGNVLGINGGVEENAIALRLLAIQEENVAGHGERLPEPLLQRTVLKVFGPVEVFGRRPPGPQ